MFDLVPMKHLYNDECNGFNSSAAKAALLYSLLIQCVLNT